MMENTINYTKDSFSEFAKAYLRRSLAIKIVYICATLLVIAGILVLIFAKETIDRVDGCVMICCGVFFVFYPLIIKRYIVSSNLKRNEGKTDHYTFNEDNVTIDSFDKDMNKISTTTTGYSAFKHIEKTSKYMFLFIDKTIAYILDLKGLSKNEVEDLEKFLIGKILLKK